MKIARGGRALLLEFSHCFDSETVQPEADQPKAETGADLRSDTN
jgi:hypothetical protein